MHKLRIRLILLLDRSLLDILLESVVRYRVQAKDRLIGVFDQDVLAIIHLQAHVDNGADNTPTVVEIEGHLSGEVTRLVGEDAEDDVVIVVFRVRARNKSKTC